MPDINTWAGAAGLFLSVLTVVGGIVKICGQYLDARGTPSGDDFQDVSTRLAKVETLAAETNTLVHTLLTLQRGGRSS